MFRLIMLPIILFPLFEINAQSQNVSNQPQNYSQKNDSSFITLFSVGTNFSSYLGEKGAWKPGCRVGAIFQLNLINNFYMKMPIAFVRLNAEQKKIGLNAYTYNPNYIYRVYVDWQISFSFIEFPLLLSYKFYHKDKLGLNFSVGPGIALATEDRSGEAKYTHTREIIGTHNRIDDGSLGGGKEMFEDSGINFNTGFQVSYGGYYFDLMYTIYPFEINYIKRLNTLTFMLSVDLSQWSKAKAN